MLHMIANLEQPPSQQSRAGLLQPSHVLIRLSWLIAGLALVAAGAGLFWRHAGEPFAFTTLHGQAVQIAGQGLYRYDTFFKAPINRGTDAVTLLVALPLLAFAILRYRRGSLRGAVLLAGVLSYFLYNAASLAFGVAYNELLLVYIAYFSASLFAFVITCTEIDLQALPAHFSPRLPQRGMAVFVFVSGLTVLVWLVDIVAALARGEAPAGLASYTTEVTSVIDLGIIAPAAFLAGILLYRRRGLGYLLAPIMLILLAIIGMVVVGQTVAQTLAGITLSTGEYVGKVGTFVVMSLLSMWLLVVFFRAMSDSTPSQAQGLADQPAQALPAGGRAR
jgi:hypothetical protein